MTNGIHFGLVNYISDATVAAGSEYGTGYEEENIRSSTGQVWRGASNSDTVSIELDSKRVVDVVALHSVTGSYITCTTYLNSVEVSTEVKNTLSGIDIKSIYFEINDVIDEVEINIEYIGSGYVEIGYAWIGTLQYIAGIEAIQEFDNSTDTVAVTMGNLANSTQRYNYRSAQITTTKTAESYLKNAMRNILQDGYAKPRTMILSYDCFSSNSCMLGIMDSGNVGYDYFDCKTPIGVNDRIKLNGEEGYLQTQSGEYILQRDGKAAVDQRDAQCTIGITEVFGGLEAS